MTGNREQSVAKETSTLLRRIKVQNLLSFGPSGIDLELRPLNVLIGPNGSGKSNLIEAISLLQSMPRSLSSHLRFGGVLGDWTWKGTDAVRSCHLETVVANKIGEPGRRSAPLRHVLSFYTRPRSHLIMAESIEDEPTQDDAEPKTYFRLRDKRSGGSVLLRDGVDQELVASDLDPDESILLQRKDPDHFPEITYLGREYSRLRIYRDWAFGRNAPARQPQKADLPNDVLQEDCGNLGLVLNRLRRDSKAKAILVAMLKDLYPEVKDFDLIIEAGTVQVFFTEGDMNIPATRLSDGTLRWLCLLAILCHPSPQPLVCIEEPELGLHPDAIVSLGKLLKSASERMQLIVTTHSDILVDTLSESPEDVIVCEKLAGETTMRRLESAALGEWLKKYSLGELWRKGEIGGNRW